MSADESKAMQAKLIEYSGPLSKWRVRHGERVAALPGGGGGAVGVSVVLDQDYDAWVGEATVMAANLGQLQRGGGRAGEFAAQIRTALAAHLKVPESSIEVAGLHKGSIIVDLNLLPLPPGDGRTPLQLYEQLAALVSAPDSPLRADTVLSNAVRVHLRGAAHQLNRRTPPPDPATRASQHAAAPPAPEPVSAPAPATSQPVPAAPESVPTAVREPAATPTAAVAAAVSAVPQEQKQVTADGGAPDASAAKGGGASALERAAVLAAAADRLQVGWLNKKYFYADGKERKGPVPWDQLVALFRAQTITGETFVWHKHMGQSWVKLKKDPHRDLLDALRAATLPTPTGGASKVPQIFAGKDGDYEPKFVLGVCALQKAFRDKQVPVYIAETQAHMHDCTRSLRLASALALALSERGAVCHCIQSRKRDPERDRSQPPSESSRPVSVVAPLPSVCSRPS